MPKPLTFIMRTRYPYKKQIKRLQNSIPNHVKHYFQFMRLKLHDKSKENNNHEI
jgi:hypothetical protein